MPQVRLSVDKGTAERLALEAKRRGMSLSRYLAMLVESSAPSSWPAGYLDEVIGSCVGEGLVEPPDVPVDDVNL